MSNSASLAAAKKRRGVSSAPPPSRQSYNTQDIPVEQKKPMSQVDLLLAHDKKLFMLENMLSTLNLEGHKDNSQKNLEENKLLNQLTSVTREVETLRKRVEILESGISSSNETAVMLKASMQALSVELTERIDNVTVSQNDSNHSLQVGESITAADNIEVSSLIDTEEVSQEITEKKKETQAGRKKRGKEVSLNITEA